MKQGWSFHNPVKIEFGVGCVATALQRLPYDRLLLVTTPGMTRRGRSTWAQEAAGGRIVEVFDGVTPNPTLGHLDELACTYRAQGFGGIVAMGGGSALDTGKVLAVLLGAGENFTLAKHFHDGQTIPDTASLPVVAIPTTSGTGSEVTPFATVWDDVAFKKYSLAGPQLFPVMALLDPELTQDLPWDVTLSTGLDALCQAFESIWNKNANDLTLGYAMRSAKLSYHALQEDQKILTSPALRATMMEASLLAGLAISHTRTALCHSMSYPITAKLGVPHGLACSFSLPMVLRYNTPSDNGSLYNLSKLLGHADSNSLASEMEKLLEDLGVPRIINKYIPDIYNILNLAPEMVTAGRADNNTRSASVGSIIELLRLYILRFY
jgi:alcohol dehydrogenase